MQISSALKGRISILDSADEPDKLSSFTQQFAEGQPIQCRVSQVHLPDLAQDVVHSLCSEMTSQYLTSWSTILHHDMNLRRDSCHALHLLFYYGYEIAVPVHAWLQISVALSIYKPVHHTIMIGCIDAWSANGGVCCKYCLNPYSQFATLSSCLYARRITN